MVNCIAEKNFVQKEVRNMVPHCERMFHVEQAAVMGVNCPRRPAMFHVEQCGEAAQKNKPRPACGRQLRLVLGGDFSSGVPAGFGASRWRRAPPCSLRFSSSDPGSTSAFTSAAALSLPMFHVEQCR